MTSFSRLDRSVVGRWWWTVDRWTLIALISLMAIGIILMLAASPAAGERIGVSSFYLAGRQFVFMPIAAAIILAISMASPRTVRRIATFGVLIGILLLIVTLTMGAETKGATRWIRIFGFSLQPSEFIKPCFAVAAAWMFAAQKEHGIPGSWIASGVGLIIVALLLMQPDVGQAFLVIAIWGTQFFLSGLPLIWVGIIAAAGILTLAGAYLMLPHVTQRIDSFFDPKVGDHYQINRSIEAFGNGGLFGRGPGEGTVKAHLPDAHSDFIFAVAGEELGLVACLIIVAIFAFIVLRGFVRLFSENDFFVLLAVSGLLMQFGLQAFINMASALHLMPTKGMTLPFISYGGSSLIALGLGMGMLLALTRRRVAWNVGS